MPAAAPTRGMEVFACVAARCVPNGASGHGGAGSIDPASADRAGPELPGRAKPGVAAVVPGAAAAWTAGHSRSGLSGPTPCQKYACIAGAALANAPVTRSSCKLGRTFRASLRCALCLGCTWRSHNAAQVRCNKPITIRFGTLAQDRLKPRAAVAHTLRCACSAVSTPPCSGPASGVSALLHSTTLPASIAPVRPGTVLGSISLSTVTSSPSMATPLR